MIETRGLPVRRRIMRRGTRRRLGAVPVALVDEVVRRLVRHFASRVEHRERHSRHARHGRSFAICQPGARRGFRSRAARRDARARATETGSHAGRAACADRQPARDPALRARPASRSREPVGAICSTRARYSALTGRADHGQAALASAAQPGDFSSGAPTAACATGSSAGNARSRYSIWSASTRRPFR